jgi:hypothetical protein
MADSNATKDVARRALKRLDEAKRRSRVLQHPLAFGSELLRRKLERPDERRRLEEIREGKDVCWATLPEERDPLVTIRIATYGRGALIAERALPSAISQTYSNLEILVIGDHCDDTTEEAVMSFKDPRVHFINLAEHGRYPTDPTLRWLVAGMAPMNAALAVAQGRWIAPCDDDDELTQDHVEVLLAAARDRRLEFVWSAAKWEVRPGQWTTLGDGSFKHAAFSHGSVLYAAGLRFLRYNENGWKLMQPGDWELWSRMKRAGVRMGFVDRVTYTHYAEEPWRRES